MPGPIVVIGSINMDLVCRTRELPAPGETVLGGAFLTIPGGKGANQAVAAARLARRGIDVHMIGRVGDDDFGRQLLVGLRESRVNTDHVTITPGVASGVAMIAVDRKGENAIVVAPGANAHVRRKDIDAATGLIASASAVVMQLEIPLETVRRAIRLCRGLGVFTILDLAPVPPRGLPRDILSVDLLTPNETEAGALIGNATTRASDPTDALLKRGAQAVALKRGSRGAVFAARDAQVHIGQAFKIRVVDTTAAGDAFTAALAIARAEGMKPTEMMRFANAAGALCCESFGAQPALPARAAVDQLIRRRGRCRTGT